ncbi:MAG: serine/threonine protein kinase, partial [Myxococcales bacterium]|nr:serine/threonine protein kinase [Myxococcales bacterium]
LKGRFEIMEQVGEGGFATVFRAKETTTNKIVALKLLKDAYLKDAEVVERFRREVFAVASINSPYVVKMHDFGISGDEVFIAMEYVEGPTLREVVHERAWLPSDIHVVIGQIAQALAAAHRQNIVHRDLKPENVILVGNGGKSGPRQVKVLDFGLAKLAELERKLELEPLTRAGMCFGTPQYMSPEQIQGKPIDGSADVYALGVIAYEMIAGLLPWDGADSREILLSVIKSPPPKIVRARSPDVKRLDELNKFLVRALAKDKKDRPKDAAEFFKEFEIALLGERKPVARTKQKVDAKDEVFASVFAASIELPAITAPPTGATDFDDTRVETLPGEFPIEPTFGGSVAGGTLAGVRRRRRLKSAWMMSIGMENSQISGVRDDPSGPFATAPTRPHHSPRRNSIPSEAMPLPPLDFGKPSHGRRKDSITDTVPPLVRRDPRGGVPAWVVAVMLILVIIAAGLGFWFGRHPR